MKQADKPDTPGSSKLMHYGMMACCAVMLLPVAGYFVAGGRVAGLLTNTGVFAPILLCVGAHFVMHKMMGKSCHGQSEDQAETQPVLVIEDKMQRPANASRL